MGGKSAQTTTEFIIVVLFFIIVSIVIFGNYLKIFPSQAYKAREQTACSQAETCAIQLLELQGNQTDWHSSGNLNELGFSTSTPLEINYSKFKQAKSLGYYNITEDSNFSIPFRVKYDAYAFNFTNRSIPSALPNNFSPRAFMFGNDGNLLIYSGSNSTSAKFSITLFFPFSTITKNACDSGALESGDTNTTISKSEGDKLELEWSTSGSDLDCINLTMSREPGLIFIEDMSLENTSMGQEFPIYLYNRTILNNEFGSSGDIDKGKKYCVVKRIGIIISSGEKIPTLFEVTSWI